MSPPTPSPRPAVPPAPTRRQLRAHPAVRHYFLFCLAALLLLAVCLTDRGLGWWGLMPALVGCLALLANWSSGPPMVLLLLAVLVPLTEPASAWGYRPREPATTPMDLVLCAAVVGYVLGHYRLLSLLRQVFPADPLRAGGDPDPARRRSADLVGPWEMALLGLALPAWTGLALLAWGWLSEGFPPLGVPREAWRLLRVAWPVLAVLAITGVVSGYLRATTATPEEALLYLQDQVWRPTRREQGGLNRWLAWARRRRGGRTS